MNDKSVDPLKEDGRRTFNHEGVVYFINQPSSDIIRKAEWHHAKVFNEAVAEGVYTAHEMEEVLKRRNLIGEDYDKEVGQTRARLQEALMKLELAGISQDTTDDDLEDIAYEAARARDDLYKLNIRLTNPMNTTCEKLAEDAKIDYLISAVVVDADGNKVWPTFADYMSDTNVDFVLAAKTEVYLWLHGVDGEIFNKIPENKVIEDIRRRKTKLLEDTIKSLAEDSYAQENEKEDSVEDSKDISEEETVEESKEEAPSEKVEEKEEPKKRGRKPKKKTDE